MIKNFTEHDILLYIYGELDVLETEHLEIALMIDTGLNSFFKEARQIKSLVDNTYLVPNERNIDMILAKICG